MYNRSRHAEQHCSVDVHVSENPCTIGVSSLVDLLVSLCVAANCARGRESSASNSETAIGAGGGGTGNWSAASASNRTRRARPCSNNALSATLSASNLSNCFSARSTNPLHSAICSPMGLLCRNSCFVDCAPDCIDLCSCSAFDNPQNFLQLGNFLASYCHDGIWRRGRSLLHNGPTSISFTFSSFFHPSPCNSTLFCAMKTPIIKLIFQSSGFSPCDADLLSFYSPKAYFLEPACSCHGGIGSTVFPPSTLEHLLNHTSRLP